MYRTFWAASLLAAALLYSVAAPATPGEVAVLEIFSDRFAYAQVENATVASAAERETSGGEHLPAIFLHPQGMDDARVIFRNLRPPLSSIGEHHRIFLLFSLGFRDGIPWDNPQRAGNGVSFAVEVNGERRWEEALHGPGWRPRAIELTREVRAIASGAPLDLVFATNAIDGNTAHDWALFGDPILVAVEGLASPEALEQAGAGVALARVRLDAPGIVQTRLEDTTRELTLEAGEHWITANFSAPAPFAVTGEGLLVEEVLYARHRPHLLAERFQLGSPLLLAQEPFNVVLELRNVGRGDMTDPVSLLISGMPGDPLSAELAPVRAGERARVVWTGCTVPEAGSYVFEVIQDRPLFPLFPLRAHAFPAATAPHGETYSVTLQTPRATLRFVKDRFGEVYAEILVPRGEALARAGAIYPLAEASLITGGLARAPRRARATLHATDIALVHDAVVITGNIAGVPATLRVQALSNGRFALHAELRARDEEIEVMAFRGPRILAGDGAFGVKKQFALFPGLEFLEGPEPSSSERDLAYPLSERRVPALYKIAAPILAVQGDNTLLALLWQADQPWAQDEAHPAAYFDAPAFDSGYEAVTMNLFAPSVGPFVHENTEEAFRPYLLPAHARLQLAAHLVVEQRNDALPTHAREAALLLRSFDHYFDLYGFPEPSPQPRSWKDQVALSLDGYFDAVWSEDPPGWRHCHNWPAGLFVGHAVPQLLARPFATEADRDQVDRHVAAVLARAIAERGPGYLWSNAGCHIMLGELPFHWGHTAEAIEAFRDHGARLLDSRQEGLWVWNPPNETLAPLGTPGGHTLGQASMPSFMALRAARLSGDFALAERALEAMRQMDQYHVPRGAQMWECPLYQPDILAAAQAVRAYCEAYRLTGAEHHLEQARYWAKTGLPFLYLWELDGYPTMRYNVISVIGSTHYTHSWLGLPVVWCGLVYAYALQELAQFDDNPHWRAIAQGITNSALWQQYTEGPQRGAYPDSWHMVENAPKPADINPENILVNELRLRETSPEIDSAFLEIAGERVMVNAAATIASAHYDSARQVLDLQLETPAQHVLVAPAPRPAAVELVLDSGSVSLAAVADGAALQAGAAGWYYHDALRAIVVKTPALAWRIQWQEETAE